MMRDIFEKKKSPFYHFGILFPLQKIDNKHFKAFLINRLANVTKSAQFISESILQFTDGHPYYTQQLAFIVFNHLTQNVPENDIVPEAINETIQIHDYDYERLWANFNNTDKKLMTGISHSKESPLSSGFILKHNIKATSTVFSRLKRLMQAGYIIKTENRYEIDDPFFKQWIINRRNR